ncbi:MAG: hypothetical protein FWD33_03720 [Alphaproteobacteria bacterium]|nr:hypothetical protein [Alphaproteobacteria bacterium]
MDKMEIVGIIASAFILASFVFNTKLKIRAVNSVGAAIFVAYGLILNLPSIWLMNAALIMVNGFYIVKEIKKRKA